MKNKEKLIKNYIQKIVSEITTTVPLILTYQVYYEEKKYNSDGGLFAIFYIPENFDAEFIIYSGIFDKITEKGMSESFKNYIKVALCHEAGHTYIKELEGTKRDVEKISSQIGMLIMEILDNKNL